MIYLDNAATTLQKPQSVKRAVCAAMETCASPGRGGHKPAMAAAEKLYQLREIAADMFNTGDAERVILTSSATHGLNTAIRSLCYPGDKVVVSGYEHNAVVRPLYAIGADVHIAASPLFDCEAALCAFDMKLKDAKLAVCTHVSNVFGFVLPIYEIAELCRKRGVPLIVDASQSAGVLKVDMTGLNAAFVAMPGHKGLYGPQGTGLLLCGKKPEPLMYGGTGGDSRLHGMPDFLPDRAEAGTHNVPGAAGLTEGLRFVRKIGADKIFFHEQRLVGRLAKGLKKIHGVKVYYDESGTCQSGVVSFVIEGIEPERTAELLSAKGIALRAGLHCSPCAHETAGSADAGTVRASVSAFTRVSDVDSLIREVAAIVGTKV